MSTGDTLQLERIPFLSHTLVSEKRSPDRRRNRHGTGKKTGKKTQPWHHISSSQTPERSKHSRSRQKQTLFANRKGTEGTRGTPRLLHKYVPRHRRNEVLLLQIQSRNRCLSLSLWLIGLNFNFLPFRRNLSRYSFNFQLNSFQEFNEEKPGIDLTPI